MIWVEVKKGIHRWIPAEGHVYECERVNYRSESYFARRNGVTLRTPRGVTFKGSLVNCQRLCRDHYGMNTMGGEPP